MGEWLLSLTLIKRKWGEETIWAAGQNIEIEPHNVLIKKKSSRAIILL